MPEAPPKAVPRPAHANDFEELARSLFAEIWGVPLAALHAGRGQRQHGVDVLADSPQGRRAVQCKLHADGIKVSDRDLARELEAEVEKAKGFDPPLASFVFATTGRRRGKLQRLAAKISERHRGEKLFEVAVFFWDDFEEQLRRYPDVLQAYMGRHFPDLYPQEPAAAPRRAPGRRPYAAFISYAHRYKPWVRTLHRNLESCLAEAGEARNVFLDEADLGSGDSWVTRLQAGVERAEHLVLVATPEALASPRVADEWQSFIARRRDWQAGHLHVVHLVDAPLPPFLDQVEHLDFRRHDARRYRRGLRQLAGALLGRGPRRLPALPDDLEVPRAPRSSLPPELRARLVDWLAPVLQSRFSRRGVATALGLERDALEGHPSQAGAASAALALATGDDDPLAAAARVAAVLAEELEEDRPGEVRELDALRRELEARQPRKGDGGLLAAYLDKVAGDHDRLVPYFQQRAELDLLDRVYVPLELRPEERSEKRLGDGEEKARPGGLYALTDLLDLDPEEESWVTRRWVVLGDPGAGKTTLVRHLAAELAREEPPRWVPVFESLPRSMREREWLLDRLARQMERAGYPAEGLAAVLDRAGQEGRLLILLDGLDEVPREERRDAEAHLRLLSRRWPQATIVVTSRPIGYRRPGRDFFEFELQPMDEGRRRRFLARWFGRFTGEPDVGRAETAAAALEADPVLLELAGNPLYLTLMALLIEKGASPERNRMRLYDQVFRLLLAGEHRPEGKPMEPRETVRDVLRRLAQALTEENRDAEPRDKLETRLYQPELDDLRETLERTPRWRQGMGFFLDELAERTGILGPHDGEDADWRFWHRTFREALAAEALEAALAAGRDELLAHARGVAGNEGQWAEPYALLAGRAPDPDALVRALVEANRDLGLRALATAQGLREETVDEILELSADLENRLAVYERLPALVGDAERALALLDRLARRPENRNGNDLYFLDRAAAAVADLHPDARRPAEDFRRGLLAALEPPAEGLFRTIETSDGPVNLWCDIPSGHFQMGSPDDEEGRWADEGPRHEVVITAPFRLAHRRRVGVRLPSHYPDSFLERQRRGRSETRRLVRRELRCPHSSRWPQTAQPLGPLRRSRQRRRMGTERVDRRLLGP